ncbi:MAG: hypothetical protein DMF54_05330 [Acidobacteria bacterium]|nr:MAG: hypothetical protein DMF54_05330 [Acidobacteriota bacterium]
MAKHILERGEHPVFYYGSAYAGSVEPHYVAAVFLLLGESSSSYRIAMGGLVLLILIGVYVLTREAFGRFAAILALAYLAFPPFFFLYKGLTSDGHYDAFDLFTIAVLILCLRIEKALPEKRELRLLTAGLGFAIGLGWWLNPITPAISVTAVGWLLIRKRPRSLSGNAAYLLGGFVLGSAPWTVWNLRHRWASLASPELGPVDATGALHNLSEVFRHSLPLLAGGARLRVGTSWDTFPYSSLLISLVLLVLLVTAVRRALGGQRVPLLFLLCFIALVLTVIWSTRYVPSEPRVLFPYYVLIPPLLGLGFERWSRRKTGRIPAIAFGGVLVFAHGADMAVQHRHLENTAGEVTASLVPLENALRKEHVRHVYTDYWTAYRLTFESNEEIIASPIPGDDLVRYPPYLQEVESDRASGAVFRGDRDRCLDAYLREQRLPYRRLFVEPFGVYARLPIDVQQFLKRGDGIPLPREAFRVGWTIGPHPTGIPRGRASRATVSFRNEGPCPWPTAVHLGYHWRPQDPGLPFIRDGGRAIPNRRVEPGELVTLSVPLKAPDQPGRYLLQYDLVFEQVDWFEPRGGAIVTVPMEVR